MFATSGTAIEVSSMPIYLSGKAENPFYPTVPSNSFKIPKFRKQGILKGPILASKYRILDLESPFTRILKRPCPTLKSCICYPNEFEMAEE